ncbi:MULTISPECIES: hypothetical protein [Streptomyces]|uniref:hypothetical protein n=1 Tax=Streptomyces TaxID=1883 RepID=UPI00200C31EA|nr:hypothetical protein [Streptomyces sp. LRE541]UPZ26984.1 hypothetical protein MUK60_03680 [Streptomyces sp. LRE541]
MPSPTVSMSSARQIENLIARYSHLVDEGDFARRDGTWSFARREVTIDFTGDTRYHLKAPRDA